MPPPTLNSEEPDVCVGPGDDERQDEDGHDDGANACGSLAHGCASVVVATSVLSEVGVDGKRRVWCEAECRSTGVGGEPDDAGVGA